MTSTINLELACAVLRNELEEHKKHGYPIDHTLYKIVCNYHEWIGSSHTLEFAKMIYDYGGKENEQHFYKTLKEMLLPVKEREFFEDWDIDCYDVHRPVWSRLSLTHGTYYIYVHHSEETEYGTIHWVSENCERALTYVPTRKTLTPKLKVGKFYKVTFKKLIFWGERINGHQPRKYFYHVKEIDEDTFIQKGILISKLRY